MEADFVSMGRRSTCVRFVKEREFVSTGKTNVFVVSVMEAHFVSMININSIARIVVVQDCARPRCVRRRPTGSTKDIAYVALSICSRMSPSSATTR